jgi:hypothetical protein
MRWKVVSFDAMCGEGAEEGSYASIEPGLKLRPMKRPIAVTIRRNTYPTINISSESRERITRVLGGVATVVEDMNDIWRRRPLVRGYGRYWLDGEKWGS